LRYLVQFGYAEIYRPLYDVKMSPANAARMMDARHHKVLEALAETTLHAVRENPT
jgi:hypothetical protein